MKSEMLAVKPLISGDGTLGRNTPTLRVPGWLT
jgi:hypothetical protein